MIKCKSIKIIKIISGLIIVFMLFPFQACMANEILPELDTSLSVELLSNPALVRCSLIIPSEDPDDNPILVNKYPNYELSKITSLPVYARCYYDSKYKFEEYQPEAERLFEYFHLCDNRNFYDNRSIDFFGYDSVSGTIDNISYYLESNTSRSTNTFLYYHHEYNKLRFDFYDYNYDTKFKYPAVISDALEKFNDSLLNFSTYEEAVTALEILDSIQGESLSPETEKALLNMFEEIKSLAPLFFPESYRFRYTGQGTGSGYILDRSQYSGHKKAKKLTIKQ